MHPRMFGYRPRYYLTHPFKIIAEGRDYLLFYWQRARRGWAVCDTWHTDSYIAEVISGMCLHVATCGTGTPYPFYEQENGDEAYIGYLKELAEAFGEYARFTSDVDLYGQDIGNIRYAQLIDRMRHIFDHFATLSD